MSQQTTEDKVRALLADMTKTDVSQLGVEDDLVRELSLDSLAGLRLLAAVEKRFDVRFPDDRLKELRTLQRILQFIAGNQEEDQP